MTELTCSSKVNVNRRLDAPRMRFDRVVVSEVTIPTLDVVAEVVAQSVAMDYYAKDDRRDRAAVRSHVVDQPAAVLEVARSRCAS